MTLREFQTTKLPFIVATGGEFVALYFWLHFWDRQAFLLATVLLWGGFLTERLAVLYWVKENFGSDRGIAADSKPWYAKLIGLGLICLSEISIWVLFVFVTDLFGYVVGAVVLFIGEQLEHSMELGLLAQKPMRSFVFTWSATFITVLEVAGGVAWLYLVRHGQPQLGGLCILAGLTVEHVVQGNAIRDKFLAREAQERAAATA